jgi:hypothetical protein
MNRKMLVGGLSAVALIAVTAASASATVIGGSSQSSDQAANATQLANATTATGTAIVVGGGGGGPTSTQGSDNELSSGQAVGSPGGGDVFIAPSGSGPTQLNQQGANTEQGSANGAIGLQGSKNGLANSQIVGGDQSCLPPAGCASSVIIGSPTQVNEQGANLTQGADGGVVTGDIIITPAVVDQRAGRPDRPALVPAHHQQPDRPRLMPSRRPGVAAGGAGPPALRRVRRAASPLR